MHLRIGHWYICPGCAHRVNALQERPEENFNESIRTHIHILTPPVQKDKSKIKVKCMNVNAWCAFQLSLCNLKIQNYLTERNKHENRFYPQAEVTINNWTLITECQSQLNSGHWQHYCFHLEPCTLKTYILLYTVLYFFLDCISLILHTVGQESIWPLNQHLKG